MGNFDCGDDVLIVENDHCAGYVGAGECTNNPSYMERSCCASCECDNFFISALWANTDSLGQLATGQLHFASQANFTLHIKILYWEGQVDKWIIGDFGGIGGAVWATEGSDGSGSAGPSTSGWQTYTGAHGWAVEPEFIVTGGF